ncbi:MAG: CDP-diacylglycerol--glycerol-3-phosphate 3-phosphatidyltransferase [Bacillota bacterium]|nr:CDP-diacylglycerol--glycerol-3-phosphate 3-phosphatidyltransferase [Bacillota bacterium]
MLNLPNRITVVRICLVPLFVVLALCPIRLGLLWAAIVFVVAAISDAADGHIARSRNLTTNTGKFLDPLADKILVDAALVCLIYHQLLPAWVLILILFRDLAVDGLRLLAAEQGVVIAASKWGKSKTTAQMVMVVALLILGMGVNWPLYQALCQVLIWLAVLLTVISGADYLRKGWQYVR